MVWYFEEGSVVLCRGWCGTLKRVVWYFEEDDGTNMNAGMLYIHCFVNEINHIRWTIIMCYFEENNT